MSSDALNGLIEAAVGGAAATQVVQGERTFDLVVRLQPQYRATPEQIGNILLATPDGNRCRCAKSRRCRARQRRGVHLSPGQLALHRRAVLGRRTRPRERGRRSAAPRSTKQITLPIGYSVRWGGEFEEYTASRAQMNIVLPITIMLIFAILFVLYHNFKFPLITVVGVHSLGAARRTARDAHHQHAVLGVVDDRIPRAVRRVGADGGRLHLVRERVATRRALASPRRRARRRCCGCGRS